MTRRVKEDTAILTNQGLGISLYQAPQSSLQLPNALPHPKQGSHMQTTSGEQTVKQSSAQTMPNNPMGKRELAQASSVPEKSPTV